MKYTKVISIILVALLLQACATKNLSDGDVVLKTITQCKKSNVSIIKIPSRGIVADTMSITAVKTNGNDGGFSEQFSQLKNQGFNNIGMYCPNPQKTEAILLNTLTLYKTNELKNISICVVGMENNQDLLNEANRTGCSIVFAP